MAKTYAIRCFVDGRRRKSHELGAREARNLLRASLHLAKYLRKKYMIKGRA